MSMMKLSYTGPLRGEVTVPGDKSISHRSIMFGALANGTTSVRGFLKSADCLSTIRCFRSMGISIEETADEIIVRGKGLHGLSAPAGILDAGNSGTTVRLLSGILAGQNFSTVITGDPSICRRPMKRIITPLTQMGADISSLPGNGCTPLAIAPSHLHGITYSSPVASAQVKSCILLAGLYAQGETTVIEPTLSRNHTEVMLRSFGADLTSDGTVCTLRPGRELTGGQIDVPGDISSAAYFIAAALLVPGSCILIKNVGLNPTRDGMLKICRQMGADIKIQNKKTCSGETTADLLVSYSSLHAVTIGGSVIPSLIDELPVLAVLAAFADGRTVIKDAAELRVKESDRILSVTENLRSMGTDVTPSEDGMIIEGGKELHGAVINTFSDHRIAMSFAVAAKAIKGETVLQDPECVGISYPDFYETLNSLS